MRIRFSVLMFFLIIWFFIAFFLGFLFCKTANAGAFVNGIYRPDIVELKPDWQSNKTCYIEHFGKDNETATCFYK